jgi:hypothetical protein
MASVIAVHEEMHDDASEQQAAQDKIVPSDMRAMVEDQQHRAHAEEHQNANAPARAEEPAKIRILSHHFQPRLS